MTITERFAIEMGMSVPNYESDNENKSKLNVCFPYLVLPIDDAYCYGHDIISVANIGKSYWNDVDTITHEYGHYAQYLMDCYGASLAEIACNIPMHHILEDHFLDNLAKEYAMELTWSEAWASTFSTIAENYYWAKGEYPIFSNMARYWYHNNNLENPKNDSYDHDGKASTPSKDNRGEAQEMAVMAFLWDLYDTSSDDIVNLGYQDWWDYTTVEGMYTLEDFTNYIDIERPDLRNGIALILEEHRISPKISYISSCSYSIPPKVEWTVNGSEAHPNNRFVIYFYDNNNRYLGETAMIESNLGHGDIETYTIPSAVWNSVLAAAGVSCGSGIIINISVGGYRYDTTWVSDENRSLSGPYRSSYATKSISAQHKYKYDNLTETQHSKVCTICGYEGTPTNHSWSYSSISNQRHEKYCLDCGYSAGRSLHVLKSTEAGRYKQCTVCGIWVDTGLNDIFPIQGLPPKDPEEETE